MIQRAAAGGHSLVGYLPWFWASAVKPRIFGRLIGTSGLVPLPVLWGSCVRPWALYADVRSLAGPAALLRMTSSWV